jgi:hypothetical protein
VTEGEPDQRKACVDNFRNWLERVGTGCTFANLLSANALVHYDIVAAAPSVNLIAALDAALDEAAASNHVGVTLLPEVHTAREIAGVLFALSTAPRWHVRWVGSERRGGRYFGAVRVHWRTKPGAMSSVIGFAPMRGMPITRRAPYVAMAVWPGTRSNEFARVSTPETLGIVDSAHDLTKDDYDTRWKKTRGFVKEMFLHEREDATFLRDVAFRLPLNTVGILPIEAP